MYGDARTTVNRFVTYFGERFNPLSMGLLSGILGASLAVGVMSLLSRSFRFSELILPGVALFLFLLRLRIFDEFKDSKHDKKFHPDRPVSRGLVTLPELAAIGLLGFLAELYIASTAGSLFFFCIAGAYSLLMLKEFFAPEWLRQHFTTYILSHELLLIPLFLYLSSLVGGTIDLLTNTSWWLLVLANISALFALEVVRKIRAPSQETKANDTYTSQYGLTGASWLLGATAWVSLGSIGAILGFSEAVPLFVLGILFGAVVWNFWKYPTITATRQLFISTALILLVSQTALMVDGMRQIWP